MRKGQKFWGRGVRCQSFEVERASWTHPNFGLMNQSEIRHSQIGSFLHVTLLKILSHFSTRMAPFIVLCCIRLYVVEGNTIDNPNLRNAVTLLCSVFFFLSLGHFILCLIHDVLGITFIPSANAHELNDSLISHLRKYGVNPSVVLHTYNPS